jgi:Outer membrane protein beta-barrel domain
MHSTYFWHQLYLFGAKVTSKYWLTLALWVGITTASWAQNIGYRRMYDEFYDEKPVHFGFLFGFSNTFLNTQYSDVFMDPNSEVKNVVSPGNFEFHVGLVAKLGLSRRWELRTAPAITITTRQLEYRFANNTNKQDERNSTWFELPITFKYLSKRRGNNRMYLLAGPKFAFEAGTRRTGVIQGALDMRTTDVAIEYGVGFEQFLQYTKLTPEIRFSHGIANLFVPPNLQSNSPYSKVLSGLYTHAVSFYIYFE